MRLVGLRFSLELGFGCAKNAGNVFVEVFDTGFAEQVAHYEFGLVDVTVSGDESSEGGAVDIVAEFSEGSL